MKIFVATLGTETNSFSPLPTGLRAFEETALFRGDLRNEPETFINIANKTWQSLGEADGHEVVQSLIAFAQPGGPTVRKVYEDLRDEILRDLKKAGPVDLVLLFLHGAMMADGYDDCESDILKRVREVAGPEAVIGAEIDLHCHLSEHLLAFADAIVLFKEYPHTDVAERAEELYGICRDTKRGLLRPTMALHDCRMLGFWRTSQPPVRQLVRKMLEMEQRPGVLSASFAHGFPYGDTARIGAKTLAVTDGDPALARNIAQELGRAVWDMRNRIGEEYCSVDGALDRVLAGEGGPYVLADTADNAGGGAPSDSTFALRRILERGITDVAAGCYWDIGAVRICMEAGPGSVLDLRFGGKCGPMSGDPIDLRVTVRDCQSDLWQTGLDGLRAHVGQAVRVEAEGGIDIVLNTVRTQVYGPDVFTQLGIDVLAKKIILLKSTQHFYAAYAPIAKEVLYLDAEGALVRDVRKLPYKNITRPLWPFVENPFVDPHEGQETTAA
ncbi:M81 family metallopeptidase [Microvirga solisilvae]|uniref:M81 family metallopeptidase n=1 Tax=Microvirga solisilvae TaxID=2919498 RepID=UPI001FAF91BB|nr:M81 family metallopeptidase [Microvirga solisilvae]